MNVLFIYADILYINGNFPFLITWYYDSIFCLQVQGRTLKIFIVGTLSSSIILKTEYKFREAFMSLRNS